MTISELAHGFWFADAKQICLEFNAPTPYRLYLFYISIGGRRSEMLAEIPRGIRRMVATVPDLETGTCLLVGRSTTDLHEICRLVDGDLLSPVLDSKSSAVVHWNPGRWGSVRIHVLKDVGETSRPGQIAEIPGDRGQYDLSGFVGYATACEILLTPLNRERSQGRTERVILPAIVPRVDLTFRHSCPAGKALLTVDMKTSHPDLFSVARLAWIPYQQSYYGVGPTHFNVNELGLAASSASVNLPRIIYRDLVEVNCRSLTPVDYFIYEEIAVDSTPQRLCVDAAVAQTAFRYDFTYRGSTRPMPGLAMNRKTQTAPPISTHLPKLFDQLERKEVVEKSRSNWPADSARLHSLPSLCVHELVRLAGHGQGFATAVQCVSGASERWIDAFLDHAEALLFLLGTPGALEIARRRESPAPLPLTSLELALPRMSRTVQLDSTRQDLTEALASRGDDELDYWLAARRIGLLPAVVQKYRWERGWTCEASELFALAVAHDRIGSSVHDSILDHFVPGGHYNLRKLAETFCEARERSLAPNPPSQIVRRAEENRRSLSRALASHLRELLDKRPKNGGWQSLEAVCRFIDAGFLEVGLQQLATLQSRLSETTHPRQEFACHLSEPADLLVDQLLLQSWEGSQTGGK